MLKIILVFLIIALCFVLLIEKPEAKRTVMRNTRSKLILITFSYKNYIHELKSIYFGNTYTKAFDLSKIKNIEEFKNVEFVDDNMKIEHDTACTFDYEDTGYVFKGSCEHLVDRINNIR